MNPVSGNHGGVKFYAYNQNNAESLKDNSSYRKAEKIMEDIYDKVELSKAKDGKPGDEAGGKGHVAFRDSEGVGHTMCFNDEFGFVDYYDTQLNKYETRKNPQEHEYFRQGNTEVRKFEDDTVVLTQKEK
jgi:hypothetical protein